MGRSAEQILKPEPQETLRAGGLLTRASELQDWLLSQGTTEPFTADYSTKESTAKAIFLI